MISFASLFRRNYTEEPMDVTTNHLKLSHEHGGVEQANCGNDFLDFTLLSRASCAVLSAAFRTGVHPVEYDPEYPVVIAKLKKNQANRCPINQWLILSVVNSAERCGDGYADILDVRVEREASTAGHQADCHRQERTRTNARQVVACKVLTHVRCITTGTGEGRGRGRVRPTAN